MKSEADHNAERPHTHPGCFIALEGPDDGGKSTQTARLAALLRDQGYDVVVCRDPGSTSVGDRLRGIVLDRASVHLSLRAEMLIFMASRAQLVEEIISPSLAAGRVVISDRYLLSNLVYQGYAGGLPIEEIWSVGKVATGGLLPDLTLVLDLSHEAARKRSGAASDRIEDRPAEYHNRVREGFREAAQPASASDGTRPRYPAPVRLIDASKPADEVFDAIKSEVEHVLAPGSRS
jgi:dTMP kinase